MPEIVCCSCNFFYKPEKNAVAVVEMRPVGTVSLPEYRPLRLWQADRWRCPGCGHQVVTGFGRAPISEHHDRNFDEKVKAFQPEREVRG